jgi:hypothetical protein
VATGATELASIAWKLVDYAPIELVKFRQVITGDLYLDVDGAHVVITCAGGKALGRDFLDAGKIAFRQLNFGRRNILF